MTSASPSAKDLAGVEDEFTRIARTKRLDMRTVEDLIRATRKFATARGYGDAICTYLQRSAGKGAGRGFRTTIREIQRLSTRRAWTHSTGTIVRSRGRSSASSNSTTTTSPKRPRRDAAGESARRLESTRDGCTRRVKTRWAQHGERLAAGGSMTGSPTERQRVSSSGQCCPSKSWSEKATRWKPSLTRDSAEFDRVKVRILLAEIVLGVGRESAGERARKERGESRSLREVGEGQNPVGFGTTGMNEIERMEADGEEKPQQVSEPSGQTGAAQRTRKGEKRKAKPPVGSVAQLIRTNYEIKTGRPEAPKGGRACGPDSPGAGRS